MLNSKPSDELTELRERVADFKKQAQVLLDRFERGEISPTDAKAEAKRIEAEVAKSERKVHELEHRNESSTTL